MRWEGAATAAIEYKRMRAGRRAREITDRRRPNADA